MKNLLFIVLFMGIFLLRWGSMESPLPENWVKDDRVGYTFTILDVPEYTDSKTIIRRGVWYIAMKGYHEIIPGSRVKFVGNVEPEYVLGKVSRVVMKNPKYEIVRMNDECLTCRFYIVIGEWRSEWVGRLMKVLPEPMASLASGILLGVKGQMPQDFYQALVNTGTLHIIAASGFNVTIVAAVIMKGAMLFVGRGVAVSVGALGILLYVLIAGSSASVVRAGIMGSIALMAYYLGRPTEAKRLLWITGAIMLLYNPLMIFDIGFQLSYGATLGLLYTSKYIEYAGNRILEYLRIVGPLKSFVAEYLYPTLAATLATLPIIIYHFGSVSLISPIVNMLVLPIVPLVMGMTALTLFGGQVVAWLTYPLLAYLVYMIKLFG